MLASVLLATPLLAGVPPAELLPSAWPALPVRLFSGLQQLAASGVARGPWSVAAALLLAGAAWIGAATLVARGSRRHACAAVVAACAPWAGAALLWPASAAPWHGALLALGGALWWSSTRLAARPAVIVSVLLAALSGAAAQAVGPQHPWFDLPWIDIRSSVRGSRRWKPCPRTGRWIAGPAHRCWTSPRTSPRCGACRRSTCSTAAAGRSTRCPRRRCRSRRRGACRSRYVCASCATTSRWRLAASTPCWPTGRRSPRRARPGDCRTRHTTGAPIGCARRSCRRTPPCCSERRIRPAPRSPATRSSGIRARCTSSSRIRSRGCSGSRCTHGSLAARSRWRCRCSACRPIGRRCSRGPPIARWRRWRSGSPRPRGRSGRSSRAS